MLNCKYVMKNSSKLSSLIRVTEFQWNAVLYFSYTLSHKLICHKLILILVNFVCSNMRIKEMQLTKLSANVFDQIVNWKRR